jgi:hypothetical protein
VIAGNTAVQDPTFLMLLVSLISALSLVGLMIVHAVEEKGCYFKADFVDAFVAYTRLDRHQYLQKLLEYVDSGYVTSTEFLMIWGQVL